MDRVLHPFEAKHLSGVQISEHLAECIDLCASNPDYCIWSCFADDEFFAIMGVRRLHPTCGEVFAIPLGYRRPVSLHHCAKAVVGYCFSNLGYNRLQATAEVGSEKNNAW